MKKLSILLIILLFLLSGCRNAPSAQIVATTLPLYDFTTAICEGTGISVSQLVTENVSCLHDYTFQVHQMQMVEAAQVVIINGGGLEDFLQDTLTRATAVIDASATLSLHQGNTHHDHDHSLDPHFWLSPKHAKEMCEQIANQLSAIYPAHTVRFQDNLDKLTGELDVLQEYGENALRDISVRKLITFHDGFSYFAESFDLEILKAIEEESGSEAAAKELLELIGLVKTHQLPAVFTERNGSTAAAQIIAAETGVAVYSLDMAIAGNSYFDAMYHNIDTLKEALK